MKIINYLFYGFIFFCLLFFVKVSVADDMKVSTLLVSGNKLHKSRDFVGILKQQGLIEIAAPAAGTLTNFKYKIGDSVSTNTVIANIKRFDRTYSNIKVTSPVNNARVVRIYASEGSYLKEDQVFLLLEKAPYIEAIINVVAAELAYFSNPQQVQAFLNPETSEVASVNVTNIMIESPDHSNNLYRVRLRLACDKHCSQLAPGTVIKATSKIETDTVVTVPKEALINGESHVAVVTSDGNIQYKPVEIKSQTPQQIYISDGLDIGDQVIVKYTQVPVEGQPATVIQTLH